jgi:hypothetical protein
VRKIVVTEPVLFRSEQQRSPVSCEVLAQQFSAILKAADAVFDCAGIQCGGTDGQGTIGDSAGYARVFACALQDITRFDGRFCFAKRNLLWVYQSQIRESKVAHRPRSRADIQRVARRHKHDSEVLKHVCRYWINPYFRSVVAGSSSSKRLTGPFMRPFSNATPYGGSPNEKTPRSLSASSVVPAFSPVSRRNDSAHCGEAVGIVISFVSPQLYWLIFLAAISQCEHWGS